MNAGTLKGAERPSPCNLEVVAEQLAWGHPRKPFPQGSEMILGIRPKMAGQPTQLHSLELVLQGHLESSGTILQVSQLSLCLAAIPWAFLVILPFLSL